MQLFKIDFEKKVFRSSIDFSYQKYQLPFEKVK